ncbi:hypothetical protein G6F24_017628 [Rhizopus arrhizus]|nr:hypothetical protein G6F24_017628 [Rhizopus arrhizus]
MVVDPHEAVAVAQAGDPVHVTGPVRRLAARLLGTGHDACGIEGEESAGSVRVHLRSRRAGEGLSSVRAWVAIGCRPRTASIRPRLTYDRGPPCG